MFKRLCKTNKFRVVCNGIDIKSDVKVIYLGPKLGLLWTRPGVGFSSDAALRFAGFSQDF